jgi:hypothetical protein
MQRLGIGSLVAATSLARCAWARAAPGDLDGSYSEDGFAPIERTMSPRALAVGPDGSAVVVGETRGAQFETGAAIMRFAPSGELDMAVSRDLGQGSDQASAVAIGPDGSILVGARTSPSRTGHAVWINPDGTPKASFAGDGVFSFPLDPDNPVVSGVAFTESGILVADPQKVLAVAADGALDPGFAGGGEVNVRAAGGLEVYVGS